MRRASIVEDVVAVEVELEDGGRCYFVTWGRVQDAVDQAPLRELVLSVASRARKWISGRSEHPLTVSRA